MRRSIVFCWALLCGLLASTLVRADDEFTPLLGWDEQLYPSFIISTATMKSAPWIDDSRTDVLGQHGGLLGVVVSAPKDKTAIKVTVTCDEIMEPSTFTGTLADMGVEYRVLPKVKYKYTKLAEITQATPVSVTFRVKVGTAAEVEQSSTVTVRPVNDCPFMVQVGGAETDVIDISPIFAAYVNEQHPFLDKVLREALDYQIVDAFTGYQADDPKVVVQQVYSIWDALVQRDVRYSSITTTSVNAVTVYSQHVRMIDESLNNAQANCVDGSVLLAALLRKVGIESFLVLVPGHCYCGFYLDAKHESYMALETTLLGASLEEYPEVELIEEAIEEDSQDEYSYPSFCQAITVGSNHFEEHAEKFQETAERDYLMIDISQARKIGIIPIAFRGKEEFRNVETTAESEDSTADQ